jgi:pyruvate/2-oxoglutarate dehydrogenase complex dihydrolipoamide acyltransferase (E2) component
VVEVHVAVGDRVSEEDPLVTLESDKATMDVPAPCAGTVTELKVELGDAVSEGTPILRLDAGPAAEAQFQPAPTKAVRQIRPPGGTAAEAQAASAPTKGMRGLMRWFRGAD